MTTPTAEVAKGDDLKAVLEAIAGHEIDASAEQLSELINFVVPIGSYAFTQFTENEIDRGRVSSKHLLKPVPPTCANAQLLDVSGYSITSAAGNRSFLVNDFICDSLIYSQPINVVAAPVSTNPFFLTVTALLVFQSDIATNLRITVFAWDTNGTPAPNVVFHWRCRVPAIPLIQ